MRNPFEINFNRYKQVRAKNEGIKHILKTVIKPKEKTNRNTIEQGKLMYSYEYLDGSKIEAIEQEDGELLITINKDGSVINLKSYLPEGGKIVTKRYKFHYLSGTMEEKDIKDIDEIDMGNFWSLPKSKLVIINNISSPKDILYIFHEMGHVLAKGDKNEELNKRSSLFGPERPYVIQKILSEDERSAWSRALKLVRRLKSEKGVNVLEVFDSFEEVQKHIYTFLTGYRYGGELSLARKNREWTKNSIGAWFKSFFGTVIGKEDLQFMENIFDKRKLSRKFGKKE